MSCPFIDAGNPHCDASLNMQRLDEAFELCSDQYALCPLYISLNQDPKEPNPARNTRSGQS